MRSVDETPWPPITGSARESSARRYYTFGSELLFILYIPRKSYFPTKSYNFPPGTISFRFLGDSNRPMNAYHKIRDEATAFILACYHPSGRMALTEARVDAWKTKMRKIALEPPYLCSLLTTSPAFCENAMRDHYQLAVWRDALCQSPPSLTATDHGWSGVEGHANITPTIVPLGTPLAPMEMLKIIKCGCNSNMPCSSNRCG